MTVEFKRGDVYSIKFPKVKYDGNKENDKYGMPKPHTVLFGWHMSIILTDHDLVGLSDQHVVVVPISTSKAAVQNDQLLSTHIPLEVEDHPFLTEKSYALTFQPITIPKHWVLETEYMGKIVPDVMRTVASSLILTTGNSDEVKRLVDEAIEKVVQELLQNQNIVISDASSDN